MTAGQLSSINILLVDDEKQILKLVSDVLRHLGFSEITIAHNGRDAVEQISQKRFDFIITDWRMPDMEGIDLVRFVRRSPLCKMPRIPIIMLTGNSEAPYILRARDEGVTEYMIKPFSAHELVKRIRSIIEKPRSFIDSPRYKGPNRRWHDVPHSEQERRKRAA